LILDYIEDLVGPDFVFWGAHFFLQGAVQSPKGAVAPGRILLADDSGPHGGNNFTMATVNKVFSVECIPGITGRTADGAFKDFRLYNRVLALAQ